LHEILQHNPLPDGTKLLILVDQFEELFRFRTQAEDQAAAFVALLLEACSHPDIYVAITMRSDFLGAAAAFHKLPEMINDGLYLTPRLTRDQLRAAISTPALQFDGEVEAALTNHLLNEAGNDPDQLPLLQHALMRLWENSDDQILKLADFDGMNGLKGALDGHAELAFAELDTEQKRIAETLFRALTERAGDGQDIRRPISVQAALELIAVRPESLATVRPELVEGQITVAQSPSTFRQAHGSGRTEHWDALLKVIDTFRLSGRNFLMPPPSVALTPDTVLDISHESLIRQWVRLQDWVKAEAASAVMYARLLDAALNQRELWRGTDLTLALEWKNLAQPNAAWAARYGAQADFAHAIDFLQRSEAEEKRLAQAMLDLEQEVEAQRKAELKRTRRRMILSFMGFLIALALAGWGYQERHHAEQLSQLRTQELFDATLTHASLLARGSDFLAAEGKLDTIRALDSQIPAPRRHARDLLAGYTRIFGDSAQATLQDGDQPLPSLTGGVAISPDGHWLAAAGERGTLALFDRESGTLRQKLLGHDAKAGDTGSVFSVVFHPKQPWLYSAGDDGQIIRWAVPQAGQAARELQRWTGKDLGAVYALALTPDGQVLASGHTDGSIRLWQADSGALLRVLAGHRESISMQNGLAFSPDGLRLASASNDHTARLWDWASGKSLQVLEGHNGDVNGVAFSPDGQMLATASNDQSLLLWDAHTGQKLRRLTGHSNEVFGVRFLPTANRLLLVSTSRDNTTRLWDVESGIALRTLQGHTGAVANVVAWQNQLYTASNDGTIKRWADNLSQQSLLSLPSEPNPCAISPDGLSVVVGFSDGSLRVYDLATQQLREEVKQAHQDGIVRITFDHGGTRLATAGFDNVAKVWSLQAGKLHLQHTFTGHTDAVHTVAFSPDDRQLATASFDGKIGLLPLTGGSGKLFVAHQGKVVSVSFDATGKLLFSAGYEDQTLKRWQLSDTPPSAQTVATAHDSLLWSSLSPDGSALASVGRERVVSVYPTLGSAAPLRLIGHEQTVFKAIFSPDSRQLATVSADMTVRLWDLDTRSELFKLRLPTEFRLPSPLWDFDFRCTTTGCWIAVPLTSGKLALYNLGKIDYSK
jgi:WD40 repeat protein